MDKTTAYNELKEEAKERHERRFKEEVLILINRINTLSDELSEAKQELKDLQYEEPKFPDVSDCL